MSTEQRRTATPDNHLVYLNLSGFSDVPNRNGRGHLRPDAAYLHHYADGRISATLHGFWVVRDSAVTGDRLCNEYRAPDGDTSQWPDELAELARRYAPVALNSAERAVLRYALDLAEDKMLSRSDEFAAVDFASLASLKRLAGEEQPS